MPYLKQFIQLNILLICYLISVFLKDKIWYIILYRYNIISIILQLLLTTKV